MKIETSELPAFLASHSRLGCLGSKNPGFRAVPPRALASIVAGLLAPTALAAPVQQAYLKASNTQSGGLFGSVAVSGGTVVVGAPFESSNATGVDGDQDNNSAPESGAAYVFVRNGATWTQQAYLKASNTGRGDAFGVSVSISGDTIVVGAYSEDSNATGVDGDQSNNSASDSGAAYVFVRDGATWTQQAYLKASNTGGLGEFPTGDEFGFSVGVSGDTAVVGAFYESSRATDVNGNQSDNGAYASGAAYVFVRDGTTWTQQAYLKASNTRVPSPGAFGDYFAHSVAISGDTIVVGAPFESSNATGVNGNQGDTSASNSGAAYIFVRDGTNWSQQAYIKASNTDPGDGFGGSVAVSGDTVVVGAHAEASRSTGVNGDQTDNSALFSGAAYVFVRHGTNWTQQAYLKASNATKNFGDSVAVSGDIVVVGTPWEASNATGINGDQSDTSAEGSGAAYVFVRRGTNWIQQDYLKASNTDAHDNFGWSVAASEETVIVGAYGESSNATGVDGTQSDNSAVNAGAAYVFAGFGVGERLDLSLDSSGGYVLVFTGTPDATYRIERASSVTGPWDTIDRQTAPPSGVIKYHETNPPPGQAFYRTTRP